MGKKYFLLIIIISIIANIIWQIFNKIKNKEKFNRNTFIKKSILSFIYIYLIYSFLLYIQYDTLDILFDDIISNNKLLLLTVTISFFYLSYMANKCIKHLKKLNKKNKFITIKIKSKKIKEVIKSNRELNSIIIFYLTVILFFLATDLSIRYVSISVANFGNLYSISSNAMTLMYALLFASIMFWISKKKSKIIIVIFYLFNIILFITHFLLLKIKNEAFSIYDLFNAGEGLEFINFAVDKISVKFVLGIIIFIIIGILSFISLSKMKEYDTKKYKIKFIHIAIICLGLYGLSFVSMKDYNAIDYNAPEFPKYYYYNFVNPKKSLSLLGLYEYTLRDINLFVCNQFTTYGSDEEIEEYKEKYNKPYETNNMTGIFKDKNLILIMLESIDNYLITDETMPTLKFMKDNGIDFTNRYTSINSGGSTILTEFTSNTGLIYGNNFYKSIYNNYYPYSLANVFKNNGYLTSSIHENYGKYYNRDLLHKRLGFDQSYFLYDLEGNYRYHYDPQLIGNDYIYKSVFPKDKKFMTYYITISTHGPYTSYNSTCTSYKKNFTEEECFKYLGRVTDNMLKMLLKKLEEDNILDNTVIALYSDHYAYAYPYTNEELISLNNVNENGIIVPLPFIIYQTGLTSQKYDMVVDTQDILPTLLNLFGIEYDPNNYPGSDAFSSYHKNINIFTDGSFYDGEIYSENQNIEKDDDYNEKKKYTNETINYNNMIISTNYYK